MTRSPRSSPERRILFPALLLAGLLAGWTPAGAQPASTDGESVRAEARKVLAGSRFQRELPGHGDEVRPAPDNPFAPNVPIPAAAPPALGAGAFLGKAIFVILLLVAVVLIGAWIVQALPRWRQGRAAPGGPAERPDAATGPERETVFEDASRLAAEGRYAEAVHALLLAAIRHFAERSRFQVPPSRTSRELVRLLPLGPEAREAFAELVRTVELSLFGGAPVGPEDWERSFVRFQALTRRPA